MDEAKNDGKHNGAIRLKRWLFRSAATWVALNLEESEARLLVMRQDRVVSWRSKPIPSGLIHEGAVINPTGLAALLNDLFRAAGAPRERVLVSIGGLHGIVRTYKLPHVKSALVGEGLRRQLRREVSVPLEEHHMVWRVLHADPQQIEGLILSAPKAEIESFLSAMRAAHIRPLTVEWKPLAVARYVGAANAAIVVMEPTGFDVILRRRGVPSVVRSFSYPPQGLTRDQRIELVASEFSLTLSYGVVGDDGQAEPVQPEVYLLGKEGGDLEVRKRFQDTSRVALEPVLCYGEELPAWEYAANLGLVKRMRTGAAGRRLADGQFDLPDLAPSRWRSRSASHKWAFAIPLVAALGLVVPSLATLLQPDSEILGMEEDLYRIEQRSVTARADLKQAAALQKQAEAVGAQLGSLRRGLETVEAGDFVWPRLARAMPQELMSLTSGSITEDESSVTINLTASSYADAVQFAIRIQQSGLFQNVSISHLASADGGGVRFSVTAAKKTAVAAKSKATATAGGSKTR